MDSNGLIVFTDGSCVNNGKPNARAGCGVYWPNEEFERTSFKIPKTELHTNNRAEFLAAIIALEQCDIIDPTKEKTLEIFTDSNLLIQTVTKWMGSWKKNGWVKKSPGEIKNLDLVKRLDILASNRDINWTHVKAHTGKTDYNSVCNDVVDKLAQNASSE